jgi:hypothetical protein
VVPPPRSRNPEIDHLAPKETDRPALADWRSTMAGDWGRDLYVQRGASMECVNAHVRRAGLRRSLARTRGHEFHPVTYSSKFPAVDFFRSIRRLPEAVLFKHWHGNAEGIKSAHAPGLGPQWVNEYWREFYPGATTKLADWKREKEYRLLLMGLVLDYSDGERRKARYDLGSLHGLIFGMKTPLKARLKICKVIEAKCYAICRSDFKFFEAYYSEARGTIDHRELNLLRIKPSARSG